MRRYKTGDDCPFCGQKILTTDPALLHLISLAASASGVAEPEEKKPVEPETTNDLLCKVYACKTVGKNICCYACPGMTSCANACQNTPGKCNVWYKEGLR